MAVATFATGPYTATYDADNAATGTPGKGDGAQAFGLVENVYRLSLTRKGEPIRGTNLYGQTTVDSIFQGGDCFILVTVKEWKSYIRDIINPFATEFGDVGLVGRMYTDIAGEIVLTPTAGSPAASNDNKVYTFGKAILAPEFNMDIPFGPTEKAFPLVFQCFPYLNTDETPKLVWFEESAFV